MLRTIRHWLAHRLGMNYCESAAYWERGVLLRAYRCIGCGSLTTVGPSPLNDE